MYEQLIKQLMGYAKKPTTARKGVVSKEIIRLEGKATVDDIERVLDETANSLNTTFNHWKKRLREKLNRDKYIVWGKYREKQLLSEELPLTADKHGIYVCVNSSAKAQAKGFYGPEFLPYNHEAEGVIVVTVPGEKYKEFAAYGWAIAWDLPLSKVENGWEVQCSIPGYYWKAWKWWKGAENWYFTHNPQYFVDSPVWGINEPEPTLAPGTAVISPTSRSAFTSIEVYYADASS